MHEALCTRSISKPVVPTCAAVLHQLKLAIGRHKGHHLRQGNSEHRGGEGGLRRHGGTAHVRWLAVHYPTAAKQARGVGNASTRPSAEQASRQASHAVWRPARSVWWPGVQHGTQPPHLLCVEAAQVDTGMERHILWGAGEGGQRVGCLRHTGTALKPAAGPAWVTQSMPVQSIRSIQSHHHLPRLMDATFRTPDVTRRTAL